MFFQWISPRTQDVHYVFDGGSAQVGSLPLSVPSVGKDLSVTISLFLQPIHSTVLQIVPDDCLEQLSVNGRIVDNPRATFCDYTLGRSVDVGRYLVAGTNTLVLRIHDAGGRTGASVSVAPSDPLVSACLVLFLVVLAVLIGAVMTLLHGQKQTLLTLCIIVGVVLRILYVFVTPYTLRAHDVDGHLEYVSYMQQHWRLPPADGGWEFYQPPLYYAVSAGVCAAAPRLGLSQPCASLLQGVALVWSVLAFFLMAWLSGFLFPSKRQGLYRLLFVAVVATFPTLVFSASRVNNDSLLQLLMFCALSLLIVWWQTKRTWGWWVACACIALALLTKSNGILLVPVAVLCALCQSGTAVRTRLLRTVVLLVLTLLTLGGLSVLRSGWHVPAVVGNSGTLNSGLQLSQTAEDMLTFDPAQIVLHPFNNAWSDVERRQYFWEYLLRSAYFGEFSFDATRFIAQAMLVVALFLIPVTCYGWYRSMREETRASLVLWLSTLVFLAGQCAFRWRYPFSSSQDFRYILFLVLPLTVLMLRGVQSLRDPWLRIFSLFLIILSVILNGLFLVTLYPFGMS